MIIKVLLITAVLVIAVVLARGRGARHVALRRLSLGAFGLVAIGSIVQPEAWTAVARHLGVGRGTDLLLYVTIVAFLSYVATRFARERRMQQDLTTLARQIALLQASPPDDAENESQTP